jgi:hypothetical protein
VGILRRDEMKNKQKIKLLRQRLDYINLRLERHKDMLIKYGAELNLHSGLLALKPIQQKETTK